MNECLCENLQNTERNTSGEFGVFKCYQSGKWRVKVLNIKYHHDTSPADYAQ